VENCKPLLFPDVRHIVKALDRTIKN